MRAWEVRKPGPLSSRPLEPVERDPPSPSHREIQVRIHACGVCRTDLHVAEGDLAARKPRVIPGHEIVGVVSELGPHASRFELGDRVGIAWLRWTCGDCAFCRRGAENLCDRAHFTGWTHDGGYAEHAVVHEDYAYPLPRGLDDENTAPLLCAGIIGYRAYRRAALASGGRLGIYGFGGSAHIAAQVAVHEGAVVHVLTRSERARRLALELGAASAADALEPPPERLDAALVFAPAGELVPAALTALDKGGTLVIAGIHLSPIPSLDYIQHLFLERNLTSVTANTRRDGEELLALAERIPIEVTTTPFSLERADAALEALSSGKVSGAAVLLP
jgi:alcohol dehydrogenase, propanol-preferring